MQVRVTATKRASGRQKEGPTITLFTFTSEDRSALDKAKQIALGIRRGFKDDYRVECTVDPEPIKVTIDTQYE
jgi:hypothetical protein